MMKVNSRAQSGPGRENPGEARTGIEEKASSHSLRWLPCTIRFITLDTGETVKRGCGSSGLIPSDVGWRCFYCGNYVYRPDASLQSLWFHFKTGREFWRVMNRNDRNFVNGVAVSGAPDPLPRFLLADLVEARPPRWFYYYMVLDENQFQRYLEARNREIIL
ncbi:MAG: hypothetical protein ACE5E9_14295 [Nitrospinaceae bacterium]